MDIDLRWEQLPTQEILYNDDITETVHYSGGLGSGKTYFLCRKALKLNVLNKGIMGGFLVPTYKDFTRDVEPTFRQILFDIGMIEKRHWWFDGQRKCYTFVWNKAPLFIFSGEKPIAGPNLGYCLINEFSLIKEIRVNEMLRRVRVKDAPVKQKVLAGTPEDIHGWLEEFVETYQKKNERKQDSYRIEFADTDENKYIDDDYGQHLIDTLDEDAAKVFKSGQIVRIGGDYFYYAFNTNDHLFDNIERDETLPIMVSLDFNVGNMCFAFSNKVLNEERGLYEQHFFDAHRLKSVGQEYADTPKTCLYIINKYGDTDGISYNEDTWKELTLFERKNRVRHIVIYCDPAGNSRKTSGMSDVDILESFGFVCEFRRAHPRLRERQILVNGLFAHNRIKINKSLTDFWKDYKSVQVNRSDNSKIEDEAKKLTHFSDGADYLFDLEYELNMKRNKSRTKQL